MRTKQICMEKEKLEKNMQNYKIKMRGETKWKLSKL